MKIDTLYELYESCLVHQVRHNISNVLTKRKNEKYYGVDILYLML